MQQFYINIWGWRPISNKSQCEFSKQHKTNKSLCSLSKHTVRCYETKVWKCSKKVHSDQSFKAQSWDHPNLIVSEPFDEIVLLIPTEEFFLDFSSGPGSSGVRVSDRAVPCSEQGFGVLRQSTAAGQILFNMDAKCGSFSENIVNLTPGSRIFKPRTNSSVHETHKSRRLYSLYFHTRFIYIPQICKLNFIHKKERDESVTLSCKWLLILSFVWPARHKSMAILLKDVCPWNNNNNKAALFELTTDLDKPLQTDRTFSHNGRNFQEPQNPFPPAQPWQIIGQEFSFLKCQMFLGNHLEYKFIPVQ